MSIEEEKKEDVKQDPLVESLKVVGIEIVSTLKGVLSYNNDQQRLEETDRLYHEEFLPSEHLETIIYLLKTFSHVLRITIEAMIGGGGE